MLQHAGMSLVNEATTKLSYNTKGWIEVFVDIAASHVKILERKVRKKQANSHLYLLFYHSE